LKISIVAQNNDHQAAISAFNHRMVQAGSDHLIAENPIPEFLPPGQHPTLYNECFVAVDEQEQVRGGYVLKHQDFHIQGRDYNIANYTYPLSEGIIDKKYSLLGMSLIIDAQKRKPPLYDLGLGSVDNPSAKLMQGVGWKIHGIPFYFQSVHPFEFFSQINSQDRRKNFICRLMAYTGLAWIGFKLPRVFKRRNRTRSKLSVSLINHFDGWADTLWHNAKHYYRFSACRDSAVLNSLYPSSEQRFHRLKVYRKGVAIGWVVLLNTRMSKHAHFGNMQVATIVDGFSSPKDAVDLIAASVSYLKTSGCDLIISNQSHRQWCEALSTEGFIKAPSNFIFTMSKSLGQLVNDSELSEFHINRGDGDGPANL